MPVRFTIFPILISLWGFASPGQSNVSAQARLVPYAGVQGAFVAGSSRYSAAYPLGAGGAAGLTYRMRPELELTGDLGLLYLPATSATLDLREDNSRRRGFDATLLSVSGGIQHVRENRFVAGVRGGVRYYRIASGSVESYWSNQAVPARRELFAGVGALIGLRFNAGPCPALVELSLDATFVDDEPRFYLPLRVAFHGIP